MKPINLANVRALKEAQAAFKPAKGPELERLAMYFGVGARRWWETEAGFRDRIHEALGKRTGIRSMGISRTRWYWEMFKAWFRI